MRRALVVLSVLLAAPAGALEWKLIELLGRLDDDGRYHVVETHRLRLERGARDLSRELGRGADQDFVLKALTRIGPDGEHRLADGEVDVPDRYRFYDWGIRLSIPDLGEGVEVAYRFEYEIVNAVAPAWAIVSGPDAATFSPGLVGPWRRLKAILADVREAWPDPTHLYRLDHDVLFPSRDGPGYVVRQIDYRVEYGKAWKEARPGAELASVVPDDHYHARLLLRHLGPERPPAAAWRPAALRLAAFFGAPGLGLIGWLGVVAIERLRFPRADETVVQQFFRSVPPEVIRARSGDGPEPTLEELLSRLATERKLRIEFERPAGFEHEEDVDLTPVVRMRLLASASSLLPLERDLLQGFFRGGTEISSTRLAEVYEKKGFDPGESLRALLADARPAAAAASVRWPFATWLLAPLGLWGAYLQLHAIDHFDQVPIVALANFGLLVLVRSWPAGWWHAGHPSRGLLVILVLLLLVGFGMQLAFNRPLPPEAWLGTALAVVAGHAIALVRSWLPTSAAGQATRELVAARRFAESELRGSSPRLEDAWIAQLLALGLGRSIERWRAGHADAPAGGTRFTGRVPEPFEGPADWTDALFVYPEDEEDEGD